MYKTLEYKTRIWKIFGVEDTRSASNERVSVIRKTGLKSILDEAWIYGIDQYGEQILQKRAH